ncbi:MAG: glucosamine-6-phosphate deaminase [Clostridia bacterium]|jgi:glucosamine-6-phosphate deaminase|nr:glucosamine-6-phosphate deaminase [Clostridia bacterium]MDD3092937.1 glucosamine-6-phosphate deaminase [Clostridia bacterium]MDD3971164.1 glucosamine-6-phosphate deaminase [Clostridia bacterium]
MLVKSFKKDNLDVNIFDNRSNMGKKAANDVKEAIRKALTQKDEINIIFAAAPSQNDFLEALISYNDIQWERINAYHMDEYLGISEDAPQGFGNFLKNAIFSKVNFKSINYLNPSCDDVTKECSRYEELLINNQIDIVCMGIGENGHIAFNDPPVADFSDKFKVKIVKLDEKCRNQQVNDGCFDNIDKVPKYAMTLTIPALFEAKKLFCMVPAQSKADAVYDTLNGEIKETCPASILRLHLSAKLYLDKLSASRIM